MAGAALGDAIVIILGQFPVSGRMARDARSLVVVLWIVLFQVARPALDDALVIIRYPFPVCGTVAGGAWTLIVVLWIVRFEVTGFAVRKPGVIEGGVVPVSGAGVTRDASVEI